MDSKQKIEKNLPSYLKRSSQGGLLVGFIYVAVFMSILILALWQTFESENNKTVILSMDERLSLIEEQIDIVDETNNDTITDISSSIQFLDKEIRKLWDLSNKRNKVNIEKISTKTEEIQELLSVIEQDIKVNQDNLAKMQSNITKSISKIDNLQVSEKTLKELAFDISTINTQLILLDDSVLALNDYKNQLNQVILEIQTQLTNIENPTNIENISQN
ncbi:MAG: hypothetical protein EVA95_02575 [SAR86 cluster bacterium]|uniref:Uncharacterized protein n=1 Tax=SAR86 cluster bacterium TaxID=2030880 RepID=A0A520MXY4_9GAMM|nr:MAG: hypothetical protein CBD85_001440 [Gammaproteobacteria bacterium TMED225]RZO26085.1 MAG: hypothetical protein EVA95_02575 [SAR86 cluster bacterium]